jgi:hypothetical protein
VSTVGNYHPRSETDDGKMHTIGLRRYYETMAFRGVHQKPYWEADTGRQAFFDAPWSLGEEWADRDDADQAANDMHEKE